MAGFSWMLTEWGVRKRPSLLGMVSGAVAGLVAITPGAGFVTPTGAFFIGLIAGPVCYGGVQLKHCMGYDDALDAFGVHAIGGVCGGTECILFSCSTFYDSHWPLSYHSVYVARVTKLSFQIVADVY